MQVLLATLNQPNCYTYRVAQVSYYTHVFDLADQTNIASNPVMLLGRPVYCCKRLKLQLIYKLENIRFAPYSEVFFQFLKNYSSFI